MEEGITFFHKKLGFDMAEKIALHNQTEYFPVRVNNTALYLGLVIDTHQSGFKSRLILNTDDCLKDYHQLKTAGVNFNTPPEYMPIGLAAEFNDDYGNQYILLEERDYNEL
jgi:hypothetical protein